MKTCESCKSWIVPDENDYRSRDIWRPTDPDTYEPMEMPWDVRRCASKKFVYFERPVERNGAALVDGSDYFAGLFTGPDFGCTFYEEKE